MNHSGAADKAFTSTQTFDDKHETWGWHVFLNGSTWPAMREAGWLSNEGDIYFKVAVEGDFSSQQPLEQDLPLSARMWGEQTFTDMEVLAEAGSGPISCHRAALASSSPVLNTMLRSGMQEAEQGRIIMKGTSPEDIYDFVTFLYTGRLPAVADLHALLRLADMYEVRSLAKMCAGKLGEGITKANLVDTVRAVSQHKHCLDSVSWRNFVEMAAKDGDTRRHLLRGLLIDKQSPLWQHIMDRILQSDALLDSSICPLFDIPDLAELL
eukprot:CAMPEP_0168405514 /NCGR_PEP_ID=MMETSP0228-20121227/25180_1 /TAXON_ID=133427 /ORGANISM="Protoceratium reticulatum, Strain CCCM 535 (=CCMP 1889)" /LENGTH=266 /DNA_ID=CAMNT_0008419143 /DNA_START=288 /DNA_END=1088 /DNA_ORIENTATION=+